MLLNEIGWILLGGLILVVFILMFTVFVEWGIARTLSTSYDKEQKCR